MDIVTWNVNSLRARLPRVLPWLEAEQPDVVCFQETKVVDELFPREPFEDLGYQIVAHGQKTYNGVAILSKVGIEDVFTGFPEDEPGAEARVLGAIVGGDVMLLNLYVVNGREVGDPKYAYKLKWLEQLHDLVDERNRVRHQQVDHKERAGHHEQLPGPQTRQPPKKAATGHARGRRPGCATSRWRRTPRGRPGRECR